MLDANRCIKLQSGAHLFSEGDPGEVAYLIRSGTIEIFVRRPMGVAVLGRRGVGEIVGEMALISEGPRSASARVTADCELVPITAVQLGHRFATLDPIARMCLNALADRLREAIPPLKAKGGRSRSALLVPMPLDDFDAAVEALALERQIEDALERGEFELHLQPIVGLADGSLQGFEALIRWNHPTRGLVMPDGFIQIAEASGIITRITEWCIGEACRIHAELKAADPMSVRRPILHAVMRPPFVSVNVSGCDLARPDFANLVVGMLQATGTPAGGLMLEVTEGMLLKDQDAARRVLDACRRHGLQIALDDFGTGYSSLSHLSTLPITSMKIDRSFISSIATDANSLKIATTIRRLAKDLGLSVVAEGIERHDQATVLRGIGCEYGQGYLYGRPMPVAEAISVLRDWPRTTPRSRIPDERRVL